MITVIERVCIGSDVTYTYVGKSTDEKPISTNGSIFSELDTGKEYFFDGDEQGWSEQADKYLDSIAIETAPTKASYYEGSNFDPAGMAVKATYTDDSTADVEFEVEAPSPLKVGDVVKAKYVENGRTRYADVDIEIKSNIAEDVNTFLDIVANGNEAVLGADIAITKLLTFNNNFVLDLNGHAISTTMSTAYALKANGAKLTIKGGSISAKKRIGQASNGGEIIIESGEFLSTTDLGFDAIGEGSKITFNGGKLHANDGGLMAFDGASVEFNGGELLIDDNFALGTNGSENRGNNTIVMNGGKIDAHIVTAGYEAIGIYIANNDTFTMNGGEIFAENGAGILMRGGTVTLNNGKIKTTGVEGGGGWIGDNKTVMSQSAIIYDEKSNYPGKAGMNLTVNGGTFVGFDKSIDVQSTEVEPKVYVYGGAFVPPYVPAD